MISTRRKLKKEIEKKENCIASNALRLTLVVHSAHAQVVRTEDARLERLLQALDADAFFLLLLVRATSERVQR